MKRDIEEDLRRWKNQNDRMPLLLRRTTKVGKSFIIERFGSEEFDQCLVINFEFHPDYKKCFESLEPQKIINSIELLSRKTIQGQTTLLFLDEIQECPRAIMALRYFKEQMPHIPIIGAGSLPEFTLNDANFQMPVGRVRFLDLIPRSFGEFLDAAGHVNLRDLLDLFRN